VVEALGVVAETATETNAAAETVLKVSTALGTAATQLRQEMESFLKKVAA
jgi:hypothetical protein